MRLKALLFDMGGTLDLYRYDRESALASIPELRRLLARAGATQAALVRSDEELLGIVEAGGAEYRRFRERNLIELVPEAAWRDYFFPCEGGLPALTPELGEELAYLVDTRFYPRSLRPEAPAALEALKRRGLRLGIVSNVLSRGQVPRDLARYGIAGLFDVVLTSADFGRRKPDPAIFLEAAAQIGVEPGDCAYVGDRVSRDVAGARLAGFALAIRIRHDFTEPDKGREAEEREGPEPDRRIEALDELLPALDGFESGGTR